MRQHDPPLVMPRPAPQKREVWETVEGATIRPTNTNLTSQDHRPAGTTDHQAGRPTHDAEENPGGLDNGLTGHSASAPMRKRYVYPLPIARNFGCAGRIISHGK